MTVDTIFDLASLTKVVATTTAVMLLVEDGRLRLSDRVSDHVPGFERYGKDRITIRHLLTHTSGLRPDLDLEESVRRRRPKRSGAPSRKCRSPFPTSGSSIPTSTSSCSATSSSARRTKTLDAFLKARVFGPLGHARHDVPAARVDQQPHRADRIVRAAGVALRDACRDDAPRRRARSDGASHGRLRGSRGAVRHRGRSGDLRADAARRRADGTAGESSRR